MSTTKRHIDRRAVMKGATLADRRSGNFRRPGSR
jgi:hypothetical protein